MIDSGLPYGAIVQVFDLPPDILIDPNSKVQILLSYIAKFYPGRLFNMFQLR